MDGMKTEPNSDSDTEPASALCETEFIDIKEEDSSDANGSHTLGIVDEDIKVESKRTSCVDGIKTHQECLGTKDNGGQQEYLRQMEVVYIKQELDDATSMDVHRVDAEEESSDHHETRSSEVATSLLDQLTSSRRNRLKCKLCGRVFPSKSKMQAHMPSHTGEKPFACDSCPRRYAYRCDLSRHVRTHKPLRCKHCDEHFSSSRELEHHAATHKSEEIYHCEQCPEHFCTSVQLANHCIQHLREKSHQCEQCCKQFSASFGLRQHILTHTREEIEKYYQCKHCTKCFAQRSLLVKHALSHFDTRNKMHLCDPSQEHEYHAIMRVPKKLYQCIQCPKGFSSCEALANHNRTHIGLKPFQCDYCGKRYRSNSELQHHVEVHVSKKIGRPYECDVCKNIFSSRRSLVAHLHSHSISQSR